ncbi:hypothetical protein CMT19_16685 [Elizabethkingia anophelis]|nr:hypothetical protein [Elizabethkingia anophelis]
MLLVSCQKKQADQNKTITNKHIALAIDNYTTNKKRGICSSIKGILEAIEKSKQEKDLRSALEGYRILMKIQYAANNNEKVIAYSYQGEKLAKYLKDNNTMGILYYYRGLSLLESNTIDRGYLELNKAIKCFDDEPLKKLPINNKIEEYKALSDIYGKLGNKDSSAHYLYLYSTTLAQSKQSQKSNIRNQEDYHSKILFVKSRKWYYFIFINSILIISLLIIESFLYRKNKKSSPNYRISTQNSSNINLSSKNEISKSEILKNNKPLSTITDHTTAIILEKLNTFEESKGFIVKGLSLSDLASSLDTNTKYLSEIIRIHKGRNFNNYINKLRINYITEMLYQYPKYRKYKISYLAEICGFSSREIFTTTFKKEVGIPPSNFINELPNI